MNTLKTEIVQKKPQKLLYLYMLMYYNSSSNDADINFGLVS